MNAALIPLQERGCPRILYGKLILKVLGISAYNENYKILNTHDVVYQIAQPVLKLNSGLYSRWISNADREFYFPHPIQISSVIDPTLLPKVYKELIDQGVKLSHHLSLVLEIKNTESITALIIRFMELSLRAVRTF
jgi:hypothetical protein